MAATLTIAFYCSTAYLTQGHHSDFGPIWMGARLITSGRGQLLYDQSMQKEVMVQNLGEETADLMYIKGVGWLTYPPTQGVAYAPLGYLSARQAQLIMTYISITSAILSAWLLSQLSEGRIPFALAVLAVMFQTSFLFNIALGQNAGVTLLIICAGWWCHRSGHPFLAGLVWGMLAFKPTWGLAIAWVPLTWGRQSMKRAYGGLSVSGFGLVALTLPFTGLAGWKNWLEVARKVSAGYGTVENWIYMRRDLTGLFNKITGGITEGMDWLVVAGVIVITLGILRRSQGRVPSALSEVLTLSAIALSCVKFMYYDILIAIPSFMMAASIGAEQRQSARIILILLGIAYWTVYIQTGGVWPDGFPLDTAATFGLWLWSGWLCLSAQGGMKVSLHSR